jgi:O-antigen ligase
MGYLPLIVFTLCLLWLFSSDGKERTWASPAIWIVVVWAVIYGSRPVTEWFTVADQAPILPGSVDEGNPVEAIVSLSLIIGAFIVLLRRGIRWPVVIRENVWLLVFYLFWLMSAMWSDYPVITLKRLFKDLGNVIMVLVVLTEREPIEAAKAVFVRVSYVCVPLSILLIRYYPDWGRVYSGYDRSDMMWVGVATHKNTLGVLAFVGAVFLLWDLLECQGKLRAGTGKLLRGSRIVVLLMCWYLLAIVNSATSLVCAVVGSAILLMFRVPSVRKNPARVEIFGLGMVAVLLALDMVFNVKEAFVHMLGRDMTLTTRIDTWPILMELQNNPLLGAGFNTFWAGDRLVLSYERLGGIIQAHNGYLETYLNGGLVGLSLLVVLLLSAYMGIRRQLVLDKPEGAIRFSLLLVAVIYNNSEASFNKVGLLWLVTLFAIMEYRAQPGLRQAVQERRQWRPEGSDARTIDTR